MRRTVCGVLILAAAVLAMPELTRSEPAAPPASTAPASAPDAIAPALSSEQGWFAARPGSTKRARLPERIERAVVIPVREMILPKTFDAMKRKVLRARAQGAQLVVIDMDTWGGDAIAALDISRLIKVELAPIHTACYVRTRAISAGALIALACDEIVMTPVGQMGDAAPISQAGPVEGVEREKMETVLRNEFSESAERNGYWPALAQCMVSIDLEAWLVRHRQTRELRYVLADEFRAQVKAASAVTTQPDQPGEEWELLRVVVPAGKLLTVHTRQAVEYGFASRVVPADLEDPYADLLREFNVTAAPTVLADTWSEKLVGFLTTPAVTGFLFFLAILCAYVEINSPGFGVPGIIAIASFALLFGSRYLTGLALWWEIALFGLGVALILIELLVIPGFGIFGVLGILTTVAGLLAIIINNAPGEWPVPRTNLDWTTFTHTVLAMAVGLVAGIFTALAVGRFLPRIPLASRLVLAPAASGAPPPPADAGIAVGQVGRAQTTCHPVGKVLFGDRLVEAMCEGGMIEPGRAVRVVRREGNTIIIERA